GRPVLLDGEAAGSRGRNPGRAIAAGKGSREGDRRGEDVALDDLAGAGASCPRAGNIGWALDRAVAGQGVAGRGQPGEALQGLAKGVEARQLHMDRLADEARGITVAKE